MARGVEPPNPIPSGYASAVAITKLQLQSTGLKPFLTEL